MRYIFQAEKFATDMRVERWKRRMSLRWLADRVGGSKSALWRWENAKQVPDLVHFVVVCKVLGLQTNDYIVEDLEGKKELPGFEDVGEDHRRYDQWRDFQEELIIEPGSEIAWDNDYPVGYWDTYRGRGE